MGLFGEFLGFDGRVTRLGYLWRSIVSTLAIVLVATAALILFSGVLAPGGVRGDGDIARQVMTGAVLLGLWTGFALTTRRLRDMGFEPLYIMPAYAALWVVNSQLLEPMSRADPARFAGLEAAWVVLQWATAVPLLLWPSRGRPPEPPTRSYEPMQPTAYLNWRESS